MSSPVHIKDHQYGEKIVDIKFHGAEKLVISSDKKIVKMWKKQTVNLKKKKFYGFNCSTGAVWEIFKLKS